LRDREDVPEGDLAVSNLDAPAGRAVELRDRALGAADDVDNAGFTGAHVVEHVSVAGERGEEVAPRIGARNLAVDGCSFAVDEPMIVRHECGERDEIARVDRLVERAHPVDIGVRHARTVVRRHQAVARISCISRELCRQVRRWLRRIHVDRILRGIPGRRTRSPSSHRFPLRGLPRRFGLSWNAPPSGCGNSTGSVVRICQHRPVIDSDHPLFHPRYTRSNGYDPEWVLENQMGPHALWLLESLTEVLPIESGMRVLDLGCGRAMTSIFLAREFGAEVWATDLWVAAADNKARIRAAGVEHLVHAVHAEAHQLLFDLDSFDVVVSIDAYQYFGTADLYVGQVLPFLRTGGRLGIVVPALFAEFRADVPSELQPYWDWQFCCFHGPEWWRTHWAKTGLVDVEVADAVPDGWRDWLRFDEVTGPTLDGWRRDAAANSAAMLRVDRGKYLGFSRVVATKRSP
jgi:SAM-dependent methyltransferase